MRDLPPRRPGRINPEGGEPEKGAPDVGDSKASSGKTPHPGDEPFPPAPGSERGARAGFDRESGEVHGSGSGAGGGGNPDEDYDSDPKSGGGAEPMTGPRLAEENDRQPREHKETYG